MMEKSSRDDFVIGPHRISCDDEQRALILDGRLSIHFSPIQYKLIKPLVESRQVPVCDAELVQVAYASENWREMHENLDKHFDNIRSKLRPHGLNTYRVTSYGYALMALPGSGNDP